MKKGDEAATLTARLVAKGRAMPASGSAAPLMILRPVSAREEPSAEGSRAPTPSARPRDPRTRVSFRVDKERHLKLRLLAAHLRRSVQEVLTLAIDLHLDQAAELIGFGKCVCLDRGVEGGSACPPEGCSHSPQR